MKEVHINQKTIVGNEKESPKRKLHDKVAKRQSCRRFVSLLAFGIFFAMGVILFINRGFVYAFLSGNACIGENCVGSTGLIGSLMNEPELKQTDGRTNALLIGIDTRLDQPGLMNTDTIIVVSYDHSTGQTFMISLPRDLYVRIPAIYPYWSRINSVYAQGVNDGDHNTGMDYLEEVVEEITGLPMHYEVMVNYNGFLQVVDELGGIEIEVENEFWGQYPKGLDWEQIHFEAGWQSMDGETALKYARTRYANYESGEASDFARSKRQQGVIIAAKDKALSIETLANPLRLTELARIAGDNIQMSPYNQEDVRAGIKILQSMENSEITNFVLEPSIASGKLIHVIPGEAYFLGPTSGSWSQVHDFLTELMRNPEILQENAQINVYNGGAAIGAAGNLAVTLAEKNELLSIQVGGNTIVKDFVGTTIYDFSSGQKPETIKVLSDLLPEAEVITTIPDNVDNAYNEDIVIVVGAEEEQQLADS